MRYSSCFCAQSMLLIAILLLGGCGGARFEQQSGSTMGTYYALKYARSNLCQPAPDRVRSVLEAVNQSMSTYIETSELSQFNRTQALRWVDVSEDLARVLRAARQVGQESSGAFDVTVGPLVNLWGFGPDEQPRTPTPAEEQALAAHMGMDKVQQQGRQLRRLTEKVYVDLSALAKGYAVDRLAELLLELGCVDFMVDIGGEIRVAGVNPEGRAWRVGIEEPVPDGMGSIHRVLQLRDLSIATSGDYRNYRLVDGQRVDHVLDPRNLRPADNHVVSATVLHPSAMMADAYATTLMVLGWEEAFEFAETHQLPAYLIRRRPPDAPVAEEGFESGYNDAMHKFLVDAK